MPEHDLSTQEYHTYWKAAWTDLGCKYKTRSRYYDTTNTFSYIICKLVSVNSRKTCTYMCMCSCMLLHAFSESRIKSIYMWGVCFVFVFLEKSLLFNWYHASIHFMKFTEDNLEQLWYVLYDFLSYFKGMFFTSIAKIVNWFDRNYPQRYWFSPQLMDLMYPRWVHELSKPGKLRRDLLLRVLQSKVHAGMSGGVDTRNRQVWHFSLSLNLLTSVYI